jgi:hypothetical protein
VYPFCYIWLSGCKYKNKVRKTNKVRKYSYPHYPKEVKIKYRSPLESAIAYLVANQQIVDPQEVLTKMKGSKSQFSEYRSGKLPPSANFVRKFWECFGVDLNQFKEENGYAWPGANKKPSIEEGESVVNEPDVSYGAAVGTLSVDVPTLDTLVAFLIRIRQGLYDGRTEREVIELFWRERTARILDRAKNTQTEKRTKGKAKTNH